MKTCEVLRAALLLVMGGCAAVDSLSGSDEGSDDGDIEEPDSGADQQCAAPRSMPFGILADGQAARTEDFVAVFGSIDATAPRDIYQLELWRNLPPFSGIVVPGTYVIEGAQTEYETCGVCVIIYADADDSGLAIQHYIAESGVVSIDFVDEFTIAGGITSARLVSYDNGPRGACETTVGPTQFDTLIR